MVSSTIQIIIAILIGVVNFGFTILRTIEKGPKIYFPSPYFTVVKHDKKYTLQGLIANKGDQSTIIYLHPPSLQSEGTKNFASTIAARDMDSKSHLGTKFTLNPNEFKEVDFSIDVHNARSEDLLLVMIYEYVDKNGNLKLETQSIKFIHETYDNYQKFLTL